jgi:hypothetical protein
MASSRPTRPAPPIWRLRSRYSWAYNATQNRSFWSVRNAAAGMAAVNLRARTTPSTAAVTTAAATAFPRVSCLPPVTAAGWRLDRRVPGRRGHQPVPGRWLVRRGGGRGSCPVARRVSPAAGPRAGGGREYSTTSWTVNTPGWSSRAAVRASRIIRAISSAWAWGACGGRTQFLDRRHATRELVVAAPVSSYAALSDRLG